MSRRTVLVLAVVAILLGILFEKQNVAFMVSLAFALAASGNFPVLLLSVLWKGCTTRGVVWGGTIGVLLALVLTILSPAIWVNVLGNAARDLPLHARRRSSRCRSPSWRSGWSRSLDRSPPRRASTAAAIEAQRVRSETGIGAEGASSH